jgi:transposase
MSVPMTMARPILHDQRGCSHGAGLSSARGIAVDEHSEIYVGLDVAKARHAVRVAVADGEADGGLATEALLAHVLVSKYADHLPLYTPTP